MEMRVAILGASGYTGAELVRLLHRHPHVRIVAITGDRRAGQPMEDVFPQLAPAGLPHLVANDQVDWSGVDLVFCALPHGTTQEVIAGLPTHLRIVDLSADFRLSDIAAYAKWYGHEHRAPDLQRDAAYGLTELNRPAIRAARLVANPGCYPTSSILPLAPLLGAGLIDPDNIIIDAKSGVSGAGRALKEPSLFCEAAEGLSAYGVANHRHAPEIEQELGLAAGRKIMVSFTPHLIPISRGMLATIYVRLRDGAEAADLRAALNAAYGEEPFVRLTPQGTVPKTHHTRGANTCLIGVVPDRVPGRAIIVSAIDNLVKGASGQAVQNMNLMAGWPETTALDALAVFP